VIVMAAPVSELEDEIAYLRDLDLRGLRARWHTTAVTEFSCVVHNPG
jgi:hypothetical protein